MIQILCALFIYDIITNTKVTFKSDKEVFDFKLIEPILSDRNC